MRDLVIISGSSTLLPPPPPPPHHSSSTTHKPHHRYLPPKPSLSTTTTSSSSSRAPLLKFLRQDQTPLSYFSNIASNLARDGKFESFLMLAETVLVSGTDPSQLVASLRIKSVSAGFSELIKKNGGVESVIGVLGKLEKLGFNPAELFDKKAKELIANECRALVKGRRLKQVVDLMEILAGFSFPVKEFVKPHEIINLCVEKRDPHMAVRYVCILPHAHILFSKIIYEFGKKGDLGSSLIAFETSKCNSDSPNMYSWRTIIDVCGRCGDFLKSRSIYEELLAQKVIPNAYVFNSLMNVNAHDLNYTLHVYNQMQDLHVAADLASYNILLKACCLAGRVDLAQNFYEEVRHRASMRELKLDVITYSTIIKVFADSKMWEMALRIKEDMLSAGVTPNVVTWSSLISACSHAGLVELATQAFDEMLLAGCDPNSQCCNSLLHAYVEARQYDRAFRIFQSWKENGLRGTCTTKSETKTDGQVCIDTEDSSGNNYTNLHTDPTRLSFAKMVPFTPTTATYNILMKCCGTDYFRAKALMVEMKMAGLFPNHITWSTLINICGSSGNIEASVRALKDMHHDGIKPDVIAYTTAIKACVNNKSLKMAFSLFEEMKKYQLKPNLVTYNTLLRARSRYGSLQEVQQCLAIYQDMRRAGYNPNDYFLKELIAEWCEGVLQNNNQHQGILGNASCSQMDGGKPPSLLLEKVAAHLQRDNAQNLAIDLRGLTKVEARIVVLAVLRMIKEDYNIGRPFQDDIVIILGVMKEAVGPANRVSEVQDAVVKLLNEELGLSVVSVESGRPVMRSTPRTPLDPGLNSICSRKNGLPADFESRRPAALQRLRVTRKSLYLWLRKGAGIIR